MIAFSWLPLQNCKKTNYRLGLPGLDINNLIGLRKDKVVAQEIVDNACQNTEKVAKLALDATWNITGNDGWMFWIAKGTSVAGLRTAMKVSKLVIGNIPLITSLDITIGMDDFNIKE